MKFRRRVLGSATVISIATFLLFYHSPVNSFSTTRSYEKRKSSSFRTSLIPCLKSSSFQHLHHVQHLQPIKYRSYNSLASPTNEHKNNKLTFFRNRLRGLTGCSWTTFRASLRAVTGVSMTAIHAATLAMTGSWIRQIMKICLDIFPSWFRYFLQPLLVLYFTPLFIIRSLASPIRGNAKRKHDVFVENDKQAMNVSDKTTSASQLYG